MKGSDSNIQFLESRDLGLQVLKDIKKDHTVIVVFSTFGEREADLIYDKISLVTEQAGDLVDRIILSHRRADAEVPERTEERAREANTGTDIVLCNRFKVPDMDVEKGKGADMRRTLYHINQEYRDSDPRKVVIVFLDADVVKEHFGVHFVTSLAGAVIQGFDFAKASFWRAMGRVKKYVAQPLFSSIKHPGLQGLSDLHYPLSGEVAGTLEFFNSVSFWQMYGVETGINIDALMQGFTVADVNLGLYDHEHHGDLGIQKMSFGIIRTWLRQLVDYGLIELKDGAMLSDQFRASFINDDAQREEMTFDLHEIKYAALKEILK